MKQSPLNQFASKLAIGASCFVVFFAGRQTICGALTITENSDPAFLVDQILGSGATLIGTPSYFGAPTAAGSFAGGLSAGFDFDSGILFSSGKVTDLIGPNKSGGTSTDLDFAGDSQLSALVSKTTNDAAGLVFNFSTNTGSLFFNFVFGSEEYDEYVGSNFNDVFAFFLELDADPSTPGHQPGEIRNLAVVPGSGDIVSINSINAGSNPEFYRRNQAVEATPAPENHELDGRTVTLTATAEGIGPGEHQLKIAIADTSDSSLDSAVLLQFGSLGGVTPPPPTPNAFATLPLLLASHQTEIISVNAAYSEVNSRLFRLRSGFVRERPVVGPASSAKSGAKDAAVPIASPETGILYEVFGSMSYQQSDVEETSISLNNLNFLIDGYELDLYTGSAGVEFTLNPNFSVGAAFLVSEAEGSFDDGSDLDMTRYGGAIYASYRRPDAIGGIGIANAFHADLLYGYSSGDYDTDRVTGPATSATGSTNSYSNLLDLNIGLTLSQDAFRHGPIAGLAWQSGSIDGYTESGPGATVIPETDVDSLRSSVGYQVSYFVPVSGGVLIPQVRATWEHEFEDGGVNFLGSSLGQLAEDTAVFGTGVLWQFNPNAYAVLDYDGRFSGDFDSHQVTLRLGATF